MKRGMSGLTIGIIAAVIVIVLIVGYFALKPSATAPSTQTSTESATSANTGVTEGSVEITIKNLAFNPAEIKIRTGSNVTWVNEDKTSHTITSDAGGKTELTSGMLDQGMSYSHNFTMAGVYNYHCSIHYSMKGKIVVVD